MLTSGAMMATMFKNEKDVLTLQINGGGPAGSIVVTAYPDGRVRDILVTHMLIYHKIHKVSLM